MNITWKGNNSKDFPIGIFPSVVTKRFYMYFNYLSKSKCMMHTVRNTIMCSEALSNLKWLFYNRW